MKPLEQWLQEYSVSHQNKTNQLIHKLCVPLIFFSILGMLWDWQYQGIRVTYVVVALGMIFYFRLSTKVALLMLLQLTVFFAILFFWSEQQVSIFLPNLVIFVLAWIGQFLGHKIEGKKPSFFEDLQFLLIGPIWVFSFLFKK
jgi:uncharacterized membrane protein YGL010W